MARNATFAEPEGPVQVYASGLRNPYDLVLTEEGRLYTSDNGPNQQFGAAPVDQDGEVVVDEDGDGLPDGGAVATNAPNEVPSSLNFGDQLHLVEEDGYYGHPNPFRA